MITGYEDLEDEETHEDSEEVNGKMNHTKEDNQ